MRTYPTIIAAQELTHRDVISQEPRKKILFLREAFSILEKVYHIHVVYEESLVRGKTVPYTAIVSGNLHKDITRVLSGNCLGYETVGAKTIVIVPLKQANMGTVKGKITTSMEKQLQPLRSLLKALLQEPRPISMGNMLLIMSCQEPILCKR
ncbi:MAG: STN domain-containing protein [bacterium]|nr:MAG: STN domain-containing protein [bacterium]